jgi:hypothetical protein
MSGWRLMNPASQIIVGKLIDVKPGDPNGDGTDGDTGIFIRPDDPFLYILKNRNDEWNEDVQIDCEINVWPKWRTDHGNWVKSMLPVKPEDKFTAAGVWVEDNGHDDKTELHPVDLVFARVHNSLISEDWLNSLAVNRNLRLDQNLNLYRFAIATDVRGFFPIDDRSDGRPPLAGRTRPVTFTPALPEPPLNIDLGEPSWEMRTALTHGTILDIHTTVKIECGQKVLEVSITPQSLTDEEFIAGTTSDQGAAVLLGEFVTFRAHVGHT